MNVCTYVNVCMYVCINLKNINFKIKKNIKKHVCYELK